MSDPNSAAPPPPAPPSRGRSGFLTLFPSIMLPMFLAIVDQTIVSAALPAIAGELGDAAQISWVVIGYLIAATIVSPVHGRLGDVFGRKRLMYVALTIIIVATALCGLSNSVIMLVGARVLQGFGGGGLMTLSQALIGETVPPRERARYQGFLASVGVFSTGFGALAGGLLTQHFGWRSVFFVSVPVGLLAMVLIRRLPVRAPGKEPFRFDALGLFLFVIFITSTLVMFREIQDLDAAIILPAAALFVVSLVAITLLVRRERRAPHALFPVSFQQSDDLAQRCPCADTRSVTGLADHVPADLFARRHRRGCRADRAVAVPVTVGVPLGSILTGLMVGQTGRTAIFPSVGLIVALVLMTGIGFFLPLLSGTQLALLLGLNSLFMGTVMGVVQVTVQSAAGPGMLGTAAASVQFSRTIGAAVGTALVGAVLFATMTATDSVAAHVFVDILQQGPDVLASLPADRAAVIQAEIAGAFRVAFLTIAAIIAAAMVLAWSLPCGASERLTSARRRASPRMSGPLSGAFHASSGRRTMMLSAAKVRSACQIRIDGQK